MRSLTAAEARGLDERTIASGAATGEALMERAGQGVADAITEHLGHPLAWHVLVLCGAGNNGGDGFVAARHLRGMGASVSVALLVPRDRVRSDARTHLERMEKAGLMAADASTPAALEALVAGRAWDVAIDAMLGTGARVPLVGMIAEGAAALARLRAGGTRIVAVDLPTGVSADTGAAVEGAVHAHLTVTFGSPKHGHILHPGSTLRGGLEVVDIGLLPPEAEGVQWLDAASVAAWLPRRDPRAHKGTAGRVLIVGGAAGMTGAALLAARGAYRMGAGYVRACVPASVTDSMLAALPELMAVACGETVSRSLAASAEAEVLEEAARCGAVALGPGLSRDPRSARLARALIAKVTVPLVIDADALHAVSPAAGTLPPLLSARRPETVLTPHVGEMARLLELPAADIEARRIDVAAECARAWGAVVLLKGAPTAIASPDGRVSVSPAGNPAMATAGMGDVLTGAIAALLAQRAPAYEAAAAAAFVHGVAGDRAAAEIGTAGLLATDVADRLPGALTRV